MTPDNWTPEQIAELQHYKAQGWGDRRCGHALGKSRHKVRHKWDRMAREARQLPASIAASAVNFYDQACHALAECKRVDQAADIRNKAMAIEAYAKQARNLDLLADAAVIRLRAERRIGQLELELKDEGRLSKGGRPPKPPPETGHKSEPVSSTTQETVNLADLGIDKRISSRAQKYAAIPDAQFSEMVTEYADRIRDETERVSRDLLREREKAERRQAYVLRKEDGCTVDDLHSLVAERRRFGVILIDPPWDFVTRSPRGQDRCASSHYDTQTFEAIKALPVAQLAADNCALFVWMVDWEPRLALDLIEAYGFKHKTTAFTLVKSNRSGEGWHMGQGYWTRANPETCWLATHGHPTRLNADVRQLLIAPLGEHSEKPSEVNDRIERLVSGPYLELYARRERLGWVTWGDEIARKNFHGSPPPTATNGSTASAHSEARSLVAQSVGGGEHG